MSLLDRWNELARDWFAWARDPEHDVYFWHFNLPSLLRMIPPGAGRVLDLGCGEGRVGRELLKAGMEVVGLDMSPMLVREAVDAAPDFHGVLGRGAELPFKSDSFDLVVASMSLHDMVDAATAVEEAARVLVPGGALCLSIVHPLSSWQAVLAGSKDTSGASYFDERDFDEFVWIRDRSIHLHSAHRPIESYFSMLSDAGLICDYMAEPRPTHEMVSRFPGMADMDSWPRFLHIRGRACGLVASKG
ncbi:class I SAM-dependent methyltransferase [Frankia sp. CcI49]|uniref:class I SAM-dependent methyltransferase n=1 Tax=Frankia sp. CcI49 TaxID=1745382 RepID=UPI00097893EE|nr:class I SAM-dependent methyltransferase [Frankia sp. CcI49]